MIKQKLDTILEKQNLQPSKILPISTGKFNNSFYVELLEPIRNKMIPETKIFVRIAPDPTDKNLFYENNMMLQEPWIIEMVRKHTSIPVPAIHIFDSSSTIIPNYYMIMECIEGTPMSESFLGSKDEKRIHSVIGSYLRELHEKITTDQFGYLGAHKPMEPAKTWKEAFKVMWNLLVDDICRCGVYMDDDCKLARSALVKHENLFEFTGKASLLHMDIWSQNFILNDENEVAAILDWDRALFGDPGIEFAVLDYVGFNTPAFWEGYGNKPVETPGQKIKSMFYHLYEVQKYLVIWTLRRKGYEARIQSYKDYSLQVLNKLMTHHT